MDKYFPMHVAIVTKRRGRLRDGMSVRSPRRHRAFLHLLLCIPEKPDFVPSRLFLGDDELPISDGWATHPRYAMRGNPLIRCDIYKNGVPASILAEVSAADPQNMQQPSYGSGTVIHLRLQFCRGLLDRIPLIALA